MAVISPIELLLLFAVGFGLPGALIVPSALGLLILKLAAGMN